MACMFSSPISCLTRSTDQVTRLPGFAISVGCGSIHAGSSDVAPPAFASTAAPDEDRTTIAPASTATSTSPSPVTTKVRRPIPENLPVICRFVRAFCARESGAISIFSWPARSSRVTTLGAPSTPLLEANATRSPSTIGRVSSAPVVSLRL
jgi:hypothetical protein